MIDPCKAREPRVIDNALIEKCIDLNYPKGEYGRLLRQEGMPMEEVEEIRFEYLYILKIDHLWVLKSLTKLSMANNYIEKIENLATLVHLRELDFSFNRIKKIENLGTLVNLEKISFYANVIEKVENMEKQTKLTVFSIGKNKIADKESVIYFRRFANLTSLNMAENPCSDDENFRLYVATYLPDLVYYEYRRIMELEREEGLNIFQRDLRQLERIEAGEKEKTDSILKEQYDMEMHSHMFVENLNHGQLFDQLFEKDFEGKALLEIGEDVTELYEEYKAQFIEYCKQMFYVGQKHYDTRQAEVDTFMKGSQKAKQENQDESIGYMETFLDTKTEIFKSIKDYQLQLEHDAITEDIYKGKVEEFKRVFEEMIHETWKNLMRLEMRLFDQLEDVNTLFEQTLNDMINVFIEEEQAVFTNARAAEVTYSENVNDAAVRFLTTVNLNPEEEEIPEILTDILSDRDAINNAIAATHDIHMQTIDGREDALIKRSKDWALNLITNLTKAEVERNRYKLLEINHFLDIQKEEFEEYTNPQVIEIPTEEYY